jgi:transposase-like protein
MTHDVGKLRRQVRALGRRHRGARGPSAPRAAIAAYARDERAAGASCGAIAERLGVSAESVRRWLKKSRPEVLDCIDRAPMTAKKETA